MFSKHRAFYRHQCPLWVGPDLNVQMFILHTQKCRSSKLCLRSWWKIRLEKPLNCAKFTWFKYIFSISLISISKKAIFWTAQKYKRISNFTKYIQPLGHAQSFNFGIITQGSQSFLYNEDRKVMCIKFIWKK